MQLIDEVFKSIVQLYDCLLTEVHERCKKGMLLAMKLNSSIAYFCYDLLSVIEHRQVFELVYPSLRVGTIAFVWCMRLGIFYVLSYDTSCAMPFK